MARTRQLKPDFFMDEDVAELSFPARLLFQGLWTLADREGRLEDRPLKIKAQVFPHDDFKTLGVSMAGLLDELCAPKKYGSGSFIERYVIASKGIIQILKFKDHQHPHPKEIPSKLDAPPVVTEKPRQGENKQCNPTARPGNAGTSPSVPSVPSRTSNGLSSPSAPEIEVLDYWLETAHVKARSEVLRAKYLKRIEARIRDGFSPADLKRCVDVALSDPFYREKGYHKQPEVIWRSAERVAGLLDKASGPEARAPDAPGTKYGLLTREQLNVQREQAK